MSSSQVLRRMILRYCCIRPTTWRASSFFNHNGGVLPQGTEEDYVVSVGGPLEIIFGHPSKATLERSSLNRLSEIRQEDWQGLLEDLR